MNLNTFTLLILFSFIVLLIGVPNVEQSRTEARLSHAYYQTQKIKAGERPVDTLDPWGTPYKVTEIDDEIVSVVSLGPNQATSPDGFDDDDIDADMPFPPHKRIAQRKHMQMQITLALAASPWLISLVMFGRSVLRRRTAKEASN